MSSSFLSIHFKDHQGNFNLFELTKEDKCFKGKLQGGSCDKCLKVYALSFLVKWLILF